MLLLTAEHKKALPPSGATKKQETKDIVFHVKWFDPAGRWTFFGAEFDGEDTLYGYVVSMFTEYDDEWGNVSLQEVSETRNQFRLHMERDTSFKPCTAAELAKKVPSLARTLKS